MYLPNLLWQFHHSWRSHWNNFETPHLYKDWERNSRSTFVWTWDGEFFALRCILTPLAFKHSSHSNCARRTPPRTSFQSPAFSIYLHKQISVMSPLVLHPQGIFLQSSPKLKKWHPHRNLLFKHQLFPEITRLKIQQLSAPHQPFRPWKFPEPEQHDGLPPRPSMFCMAGLVFA